MINPWDLKTDDQREADSLPTFIIFCEDEVSEPVYFKYFATDKIKVNPIGNQKSDLDNVMNAIKYVEDNEFTEDAQLWCVFDRDTETNTEQIKLNNIKFNESIELAIRKGFKVAWSNDAFELWILLHFENIDFTLTDYKKRSFCYDRLSEIFKNIPNPNSLLTRTLQHNTFSYKKDMKQKRNFEGIVMDTIIPNTNIAIERAIRLEKHCNENFISCHQKSPCTLVHHLVQELLRLGGKELP
ncbi:MAG: hypothetical protein ACI85O_003330, partial [Saprospiraceae bacterium]